LSSLAVIPLPKTQRRKAGLAFWMLRVLEECDHAAPDLAADPVHDLRVCLRRCRSMADGIMTVDPDPGWKQMKKAGKRLFSSLGDLRDVHVMAEWVQRLGGPDDPVTTALLHFLNTREGQLKTEASRSLKEFDRKQWARWSRELPRRASRLRQGSVVFGHLALERWNDAHELHRMVLRHGSQSSWHRLRIGLKRFRYLIENFLPQQHAKWKDDLKELQDLLGEVHDLDVLWATALDLGAFPDESARLQWHTRIEEERAERIRKYRAKMMGTKSFWQIWREELPQGGRIAAAGFKRMELWASFRDPDLKHSSHVVRLALQLYDGLVGIGESASPPVAAPPDHGREILRAAALLHDVGRFRKEKGHHKAAYRLICQMPPPLGWQQQDLQMAAIAVRYHRGGLPRAGQRALRGLSRTARQQARLLAGILRLANAFDAERDRRIRRLELVHRQGVIVVAAEGYSPLDQLAESVAAARHLLEVVLRRPIVVRPLKTAALKARGRAEPRKPAAILPVGVAAKAHILRLEPRRG
jgi:CHAD domain-containing protein